MINPVRSSQAHCQDRQCSVPFPSALPDSGLSLVKSHDPVRKADYDTWQTNMDLFLTDPSISDLERSCKIFEGLLPPAADIVQPLGPQASPSAYLELLNSVFGTVADGDKCFAFLSTLQNGGEKPSEYLHRLQVVLNTAMKRAVSLLLNVINISNSLSIDSSWLINQSSL